MHSSRVLRVLPRLASRPFAAARAATSASTLAAHPHAPFFSRTGRTGVLLACSGAARWFGAFPNHVLSSDSTPTIPLDIPPTLSQSQLDALPDTYLQYVSGYGYFPIPDPVASAELLRADLAAEGFKGRIYVSHEGINVQAACHPRDSQRLVELVRAADRGRFAGMRLFRNEIFDFAGKGAPFSKLVCKHRALINEGILPEFSEKISEHLDGYKHLPPAEWHEEMMRIHKAKAQARAEAGSKNADANALIFDVRNIYEYEIGSFAHAKPISVDSFSGTYPDLDRLLGLTGPNTASAHVDTVDGADPVLLAAKHTRSRQFSTDKTGKQVDAAQARLDFDATVLPTIDWDAVVVSPTDVETLLARARARASSGDYAAAAQDARAAADAAEVEAAPAAPAVPAPAGPVAKDTKIRMFCTGGIRCVKVGAYLAQQGFTDVAVLEGGVNAYAGYIRNIASGAAEAETAADGVTVDESVAPRASTPSQALSAASAASTFIGANVVFDERRSVRVTDHDLGRCHSCGAPCSLPNNCVQPRCNTLLLRCARCTAAYGGACSALCAFEFDGGVNVVGNIIEANKSEAHTCEDRAKHPITLRLYGPQTNRNRPRIAPITRPLDFA